MKRPSGRRYDREIFALALPALGALAAEPTYLLVDTAIVGHLGTPQLAALAIAATLLGTAVTLFNFLTYGTTARVARLHGAGEVAAAGRIGSQALWLSLALGGALLALILLFAAPAVALMGGTGETAEMAVSYLRISALGVPFAMIALAGQGFLRGVGNLRAPLVILVAANAANAALEVLFVYGFGWGLAGSAWGTVIAQAGMGAAFVFWLLRAPADSRRPSWTTMRPLLRVGGDIAVRTGALLLSFALASAVVARIGEAPLAAHQVAFGLFIFLALVLDAVAIAGQILVGRSLGAGDAEGAYEAARRMIFWSVVLGGIFCLALLAGTGTIPRLFTGDPDVVERAGELWPLFAFMQPVGAAVFALDGILIGAGDTRFLKWSMVLAFLAFAPLALAALALDVGVVGVWAALNVLMLVRLATCGARFLGRRWAVVGAPT
ncbi:MAG: MATE family efflux transporter [Rubrobacter sp.]|nr:MATE family efflux transporter [Rubrobacteraceae bacterium]MBA3795576.1 MATE family efflux transporter [Rubrobacter sp.]MDQ3429752.1 MATE family efflux transporter [Actinomycetota bacterium]